MPLFPLLFIAFVFVGELSRNYLCSPLVINFNWRSFIFDSIGGNLTKQHFEYHYSTSSVILLSFCVYTKKSVDSFSFKRWLHYLNEEDIKRSYTVSYR